MELRFGTIFMTAVCATMSLVSIFTVIFTGGVGKNGSTVAVSWGAGFHCMILFVNDCY